MMLNPFKSIVELQLEMLYQWLTISKQWLEVYSATSASVKPIPVVVQSQTPARRSTSCVGPADLKS